MSWFCIFFKYHQDGFCEFGRNDVWWEFSRRIPSEGKIYDGYIWKVIYFIYLFVGLIFFVLVCKSMIQISRRLTTWQLEFMNWQIWVKEGQIDSWIQVWNSWSKLMKLIMQKLTRIFRYHWFVEYVYLCFYLFYLRFPYYEISFYNAWLICNIFISFISFLHFLGE